MEEKPYYEIRLESIGGLGANLCGKMLGELGVSYLNLNGAAFSSYGSEKRGSPVRSFIRWCKNDREILINSPVESPDVLAVFSEGVMRPEGIADIRGSIGCLVINTAKAKEELHEKFPWLYGKVYLVDAKRLAMVTKSRVNMIMMGAIIRAIGTISPEVVEKLVVQILGDKYPDLLEANLNGVRAGFEQSVEEDFGRKPGEVSEHSRETILWGYENAPIGGVNPIAGSTASNDLSPSREGYMPEFHLDKCIHCGLCDSTCPDMVFQFMPGIYKGKEQMTNHGLDYHYCKGCLRCVDVCPTDALTKAVEADVKHPLPTVRDKDLVKEPEHWTKKGADAWITGESDNPQKRPDGIPD